MCALHVVSSGTICQGDNCCSYSVRENQVHLRTKLKLRYSDLLKSVSWSWNFKEGSVVASYPPKGPFCLDCELLCALVEPVDIDPERPPVEISHFSERNFPMYFLFVYKFPNYVRVHLIQNYFPLFEKKDFNFSFSRTVDWIVCDQDVTLSLLSCPIETDALIFTNSMDEDGGPQ